ncbi:MAG: cytochrome b N-terminal domain-containing protein [Planctomycetes bacterium]|nr:cytochrome b N-terminal domain-containing protein [Planctomycetota bacterium]
METTSQIESELLAEVNQELERRGTSMIVRKDADDDTLGALVVTAILAVLAILAGTGIAMGLLYTPTVEDANASTAWFGLTLVGAITRNAHYHAANLLVLLSASYLGYLCWRGLFRRPGQWRWWRAMLLLGLVLAFGLTGQLLPFDQLALHGTDIRLGYLAQAPVVGPALRDLVQGGESIGTATLARFFGMHAILLPALAIILARALWRDADSNAGAGAYVGVAGAVVVLVFAVAFFWHAPLGLQGNLSEVYAEARPEWYALPLYALLKLAPPGPAHLLVLFALPLLGVVVLFALPFVETVGDRPARLRKPLQIGVIAAGAVFLIFALLPVFQDMSDNAGWFTRYTPEDIMTAMGPRNDGLRNSAEPAPTDTHVLARDLELLHQRLLGVYPEVIDDAGRAKWDELAGKGAEAARLLRFAGSGDEQMKLRDELRQVCVDCHEYFEEDIRVDPVPRLAIAGDDSGDERPFFFDQQVLNPVTPTELDPKLSTKKLMDQLKWRLGEILAHAGITERNTTRSPEQNLVDLRYATTRAGAKWDSNKGSWFDEKKWDDWIADLRRATDELALARTPTEVAARAREVGKTCEACHDGGDDLDEPIEWRFESLLQPD